MYIFNLYIYIYIPSKECQWVPYIDPSPLPKGFWKPLWPDRCGRTWQGQLWMNTWLSRCNGGVITMINLGFCKLHEMIRIDPTWAFIDLYELIKLSKYVRLWSKFQTFKMYKFWEGRVAVAFAIVCFIWGWKYMEKTIWFYHIYYLDANRKSRSIGMPC